MARDELSQGSSVCLLHCHSIGYTPKFPLPFIPPRGPTPKIEEKCRGNLGADNNYFKLLFTFYVWMSYVWMIDVMVNGRDTEWTSKPYIRRV